jgi:hypothetical protein
MNSRPLLALLLLASTSSVAAAACQTAPQDSRIGVAAPDRASFQPTTAARDCFTDPTTGKTNPNGSVGDVLARRCGSLDCHGQPGRNFQVFHVWGMRLAPNAVAGGAIADGGDPKSFKTSDAEYDATYRSLVALEPALMSQIVAQQGHGVEALTFVRKATGTEEHKGGAVITPGDDQDVCIRTWLAGSTDTGACTQALCLP